MSNATYIITGGGALRRHAWNFTTGRTLCGRERELNRALVPGELRFVNCQVCQVALFRAQGNLQVLEEQLGKDMLIDVMVQAGVVDDAFPKIRDLGENQAS